MPGKQVKNWPQYEALRRKGMSKSSAARITNADAAKKKRKTRSTTRSTKKRSRK